MPNGYEVKETILSAHNISVSYSNKAVLKDLNLQVKNITRPGVEQGQVIGLLGPSGVGKAQPLDANILTPDGFVPMGTLRLGDLVIGSDGNPVRVLGVFPQGVKDVYRVTFSDGSSTECCDEHLWYTETRLDRNACSGKGRRGTVKPLSEIRETVRCKHGIRTHSIPLVTAVRFPDRDVPIDPYLMGLLLGDGSFSSKSQVRFTTVEPSLLEQITLRLPTDFHVRPVSALKIGIDYRLCHSSRMRSIGRGYKNNPLINGLRNLGLMGCRSHEKFIPDCYLINSVDVRLQVLQGLMDTDGERSRATIFNTTSLRLAEGVQFIAQSLGGTARIRTKQTRFTYNGEQKTGKLLYRVTIALPNSMNPFRLPRKAERVIPRTVYPIQRTVDNVELIGKKECQCIYVDSPDHLYVTDNFLLTHNTTLFRCLAGLMKPDTGEVRVTEKLVPVERGMVGVVAQHYPLFSHRTVLGNLAVAGRQAGLSGDEAKRKAIDLLKRFGIEEQKDSYPAQLSGGQRQRVAIAQQFMCSDHFLLMDEPFSGLDLIAIERVSDFIIEIAQTDELKTIIIVTHDIDAALAVCDTVWLLGRDRDASDKPIPGARIQQICDLAERGLAWRKGHQNTPEFLATLGEVREAFTKL